MDPLNPLPPPQPVLPRPAPPHLPAAGREAPSPAISGRQPHGAQAAPLQASLRFDKLARQVVVLLVEPETGEVVHQIPPEKILSLIVYLRQAADQTSTRG